MSDALLVLEDGTTFRGRSVGAEGTAIGEAVFNTGMTGYQEVLTDPSYTGQLVVMTASHIGNTGWNEEDSQSDAVHVRGFIVREMSRATSNWRATSGLTDVLKQQGVVAIDGVDTRALTRRLRDAGAMRAAVSTETLDEEALLAQVKSAPSMEGRGLANEVTTAEVIDYPAVGEQRATIVAVDYGMKSFILRGLREAGARVVRVPSSTGADDILGYKPDGVFLSNGPGDPAALTAEVETVRTLLGEVAVFGICLGCQLLALAAGARTYKLPYGHHGVNLPVMRRADGVVEITSQNHGFCIDAASLGDETGEYSYANAEQGTITVTHINMNDDTVAGIELTDRNAYGVQYHPEAGPGPNDAVHMLAGFVDRVAAS